MAKVISVKYLGEYSILVQFENNKQGVVDFSHIIHSDNRPLIKALEDKNFFSDFTISCNSITWKNGVDISPDYLMELATKQTENRI